MGFSAWELGYNQKQQKGKVPPIRQSSVVLNEISRGFFYSLLPFSAPFKGVQSGNLPAIRCKIISSCVL